MATSGSISARDNQGYEVVLSWWLQEQSIANNNSKIYWNLRLINATGIIAINERTYTVIFDGQVFSGINDINISVIGESKLLAQGYALIPHSEDGTKTFSYSFEQQWDLPANSVKYLEASGEDELPELNKPILITHYPKSFTDIDNPSITLSSYHGFATIEVGIASRLATFYSPEVPYRQVSGTYYIFDLTDAERTALFSQFTSNAAPSVYFVVKTTYPSGDPLVEEVKALVNITTPPTISVTLKDTNSTTIGLTGDDTKIISGYSSLNYAISATGAWGATIKSYEAINNKETKTTASGTFATAQSDTIIVKATDSRGITGELKQPLNIVPYNKLSGALSSFTIEAEDSGANGKLNFVINGNYYSGSFGATNNTLTIKYTLYRNGQSYKTGIYTPTSTNDGLTMIGGSIYTFTNSITGIPLDDSGSYYSYTMAFTIEDKLSGIVALNQETVTYMPIFDWGAEDFNFNVPVHFSRGFTDDTALKTATSVITVTLGQAGRYSVARLVDMGLSMGNEIYSVTGTLTPESSGRVYPLPIPALTLGAAGAPPQYSIEEAARLSIENDEVYLSISANWGTAKVRIVIMYF